MIARRTRLALALALALVAVASLVAVPAHAADGTIELTASASLVTYGDSVTLSGSLAGGEGCTAGRALQLEWEVAGSSAFETVAEGAAGTDGSFSFEQTRAHSGGYRVTASASGPCPQIGSASVPVRVRVHLDSALVGGPLTAGSCVDFTTTVSPPKPGQSVDLQRKGSDGWTDLQTLTLDAESFARARPCFGWEDVGIVRLRMRWDAPDLLNESNTGPALAFQLDEAEWMRRIDALVAGRAMSVSVGEADAFLYGHAEAAPRTPASNEKLLLSMALLDALGPSYRIPTRAAASAGVSGGVLEGNLWILGRGDPEVDRRTMAGLARHIAASGVTRIEGRVMGGRDFFLRDWDAPGWNDHARDYVARPTALVYAGNLDQHGHDVRDPEELAAEALTRELERIGVDVGGKPGSGTPPDGLTDIALVRSRALHAILARLLRPSDNFYAEVLGKRLGVKVSGAPGTIAKGAAAIRAWISDHGVDFALFDNSGLSYDNRITAQGIVRLLWAAEAAPWQAALFDALPQGGQGTLKHRFATVRVHAKTGTLTDISALSGWVWLDRLRSWGEFSILSRGMSKATASDLEDRIVRILQNQAH